ncbi:MAG TPA: hypothetical protein VEA16_03300 [Vicinamibacterales bacterium]|nr:hypothetical protein [Vicinamibacterales bacterium]
MTAVRILAFLLLLAGALALAFGGFSYTKRSEKADIGPISLSWQQKERIQVPVWLALGAVVGGGLLLLLTGGRR